MSNTLLFSYWFRHGMRRGDLLSVTGWYVTFFADSAVLMAKTAYFSQPFSTISIPDFCKINRRRINVLKLAAGGELYRRAPVQATRLALPALWRRHAPHARDFAVRGIPGLKSLLCCWGLWCFFLSFRLPRLWTMSYFLLLLFLLTWWFLNMDGRALWKP